MNVKEKLLLNVHRPSIITGVFCPAPCVEVVILILI